MFKKFSAALIVLLLLIGTSSADIIYVTSDGTLGSIAFTASSDISAPSTGYKSGITEPYLSAYWTGNTTNLILLEPDKTESGDRAYVFSTNSLSSPNASVDIAGVHDAYLASYARNGRSLFMAAGTEIFEVETSDFKVVNSYDCRRILSGDGSETEIVSLLVDENYVHAIVGSGNDRKFVRFDGQLKDSVKYFISADVSADASCLFELNNTLLLGCRSEIAGLNARNQFISYLILSEDAAVVSMCEDDEGYLYYAARKPSNSSSSPYTFTVTNTLNSSVRTKFAKREIISSYPYIKMLRDKDRNVLAIMTAESILVFDVVTGESLRSFSAAELGGRPLGMFLSSVPGYSSSSSSSGCTGQNGGFLLAGIAGFAVNKLRKKRMTSTEDPFYSPANMARLKKSIAQLNANEGTEHELIEVD